MNTPQSIPRRERMMALVDYVLSAFLVLSLSEFLVRMNKTTPFLEFHRKKSAKIMRNGIIALCVFIALFCIHIFVFPFPESWIDTIAVLCIASIALHFVLMGRAAYIALRGRMN